MCVFFFASSPSPLTLFSNIQVWGIFGFDVFLTLVILANYIFIEVTDPALEGGIPCPCVAESQKGAQYDTAARKMIPGYDHHCSWLNTSIGKRNYVQFLTMTMTSSGSTLTQSFFSLFSSFCIFPS